ncbi:MAG TPA: hypothetical protein VFQ37_07520 [Mycobacterium sp.]|nr:hypothetical protein [Mycobacterium sp.]
MSTGISLIAAAVILAVVLRCSVTGLRQLRRRLPHPPRPAHRDAETSPARPGPAPRPFPESESRRRIEARLLTDPDLCRAWRASYSALQRTSSAAQRLRVVGLRAELLDELEHRNPDGFLVWMASGARAAADPTRYLTGHNATRPRPIDWDELISGTDR